MIEIIPTVVPNMFDDVIASVDRYRGIVTTLQIDGADGKFAPNTTWLSDGAPLPKDMSYEAHIMVNDARGVGEAFARAGCMRIIGHVEVLGTAEEAEETFEAWRAAGASEVGAGILMETPLEKLEPLADLADTFLVMCIARVGTMGIPFDERGIERVRELHERYPEMSISVDGGVSENTIAALAKAGATRFSVGSALAKAVDPKAAYSQLLSLASTAV